MNILLTIDIEPDYSTGTSDPYLHIPTDFRKFMDLSIQRKDKKLDIVFFVTGDVARNFSGFLNRYLDFVEVGIHTHPRLHPEYGVVGDNLARYSFEEQMSMISRDLESIESSLGVRPKIFRAGKLKANKVTLKVLRELNIPKDSSLLVPYIYDFRSLWNRPWRPFVEEGILRIPVVSADRRIIDFTGMIKKAFIKIVDPKATICFLLHSWFCHTDLARRLLK